MSNKLFNIVFSGGKSDGEILENCNINPLPIHFYFPSETFFAESKSGNISIRKGKINRDWHSYSQCIYARNTHDKMFGDTVEYKYLETRMIDRCSSLTNKKVRCMKPAIHQNTHCLIHAD